MKTEYKELIKRIEKLPEQYQIDLKDFIEGLLSEYEKEVSIDECYKSNHVFGPWSEQTVGEWAPEMAGYWFNIKPDMKTKNVYERKCARCGLTETMFDKPEGVKTLIKKKDEK